MYILNPDTLAGDKIYFCNGIIGEYLIYTKHFPLFCKKGRLFGFARTKELEDVLRELPFWLKITKIF